MIMKILVYLYKNKTHYINIVSRHNPQSEP